jgi:hypothetical protein
MSSKPVVKKLACDSKEARTNHVRSKLSDILKVYLENMFPEYYPDNRNIGPFKYRFRLSIFQINYSIHDIDIDYRTALRDNERKNARGNDPLVSVVDHRLLDDMVLVRRDSPIFLQFFYLFSIFFLNCF